MQSLAHQFLTFCRSKPADEAYEFCDSTNCAIAQFLRVSGYPVHYVDSGRWYDPSGKVHALPQVMRGSIDGGPGYVTRAGSFGALADYLEAALASK